jgi:hypothetical protein
MFRIITLVDVMIPFLTLVCEAETAYALRETTVCTALGYHVGIGLLTKEQT